jgi:membrane-associated phospholipid phosphatase
MLDVLHELELILNVLYQEMGGSLLAGVMKAASFLGTEDFFMLVMPALYWCVGVRFGLRLGVMLLFSNGVNSVLKLAFHSPRPYWIDPHVQAMGVERSFGLPSNHAQTATVVWGFLGASVKRAWAIIGGVILILLIGLSRIYLGMHFLSDVIVGWVVGGFILLIFIRLEDKIAGWVSRQSLRTLLWGIALSAAAFIVLIVGARLLLSAWQPPAEWNQLALTASGEGIDPLNIDSAFTLAGTWFGMLAGAAWLFRAKGGMDVAGNLDKKILRYLVGLVGVAVLWFGLGQIFPREADFMSYFLRFVRYTLVGAWVSAFAPLLFRRLGLVK